MSELTLWFTSHPDVELIKCSFSHPFLTTPKISVRGKTSGAYRSYGTFQWTPAVQALSILVLKTKAAESLKGLALLSGEQGSAAASLDYALSKQPDWLMEMFGLDKHGLSLARRIINRSNPERRFTGPVSLSIKTSELVLKIFVDNQEIATPNLLNQFAGNLELNWMGKGQRKNKSSFNNYPAETAAPNNINSFLKEIYLRESRAMLEATNIFNRSWMKRSINNVTNDSSFSAIAGKNVQLISPIDLELAGSNHLGISENQKLIRQKLSKDIIRIAIPISLASSIAIFNYLRKIKGYLIEPVYSFPHGGEIARRIIKNDFDPPFDAFVAGVAPTATLANHPNGAGYQRLMFMPSMTHRVATKRPGLKEKNSQTNYGRYVFVSDDPTTAAFYFNDLKKCGFVNHNKISTAHIEHDEAARLLREGDPEIRSVSFFPYYNLYQKFNDCILLDDSLKVDNTKEAILVVHESLYADKLKVRCLDIAIRDAWLTLLEDKILFKQMIEAIVEDPLYFKCLRRFSGFEQVLSNPS